LVTAFPDEVSIAEAAEAGAVRLLGKQGSRTQLCADLLASVRGRDVTHGERRGTRSERRGDPQQPRRIHFPRRGELS
jgi:hypothetical protein